jgi:hypothetical protein
MDNELKQEDAQFDLEEYAKWVYDNPYAPATDNDILSVS